MSFFDKANGAVMRMEQSFVNLIASVVPWLAPIVPAVFTYKNMVSIMDFNPEWAIITALVVEFLGLTTVSTAFLLWRHNKHYTDKKYHLPLWIPVSAFFFYLFVVVTVNVLIEFMGVDYPEYEPYTRIAAKALLVFLTVPASAILVVRAQYTRIVQQIKSRYAKPKKQKAKPVQTEKAVETHTCEWCPASFGTVQALSAHKRWCEKRPPVRSSPGNGKTEASEIGGGEK